MKEALLIIDLQNDYFAKGKYPLWNAEQVLENIKSVMHKAQEKNTPMVLIEHVVPKEAGGLAPFFNEGTEGVKIHKDILALAPHAIIITKHFADAFHQTNLDAVLTEWGIEKITLCGMMTQNCVTHTALSKQAEKYSVSIIPECTTTVDEMLHAIALHALSTRITFESM